MDIEKSLDEELLESINDERGKYSSDFLSEIRLELLFRGYKEVNGVWKKLDRDAAVAELGVIVKGLIDRLDAIEKRGGAATRVVDPKFLNRAFAIWGHFVVANLILGLFFGLVALIFE